jgi:mono/diheme cytochrome c family protein
MRTHAQKHPLLIASVIAMLSVIGAFGVSRIAGTETPGAVTPPRAAAATAGRGRKLFVQSCAHCHGDDARGSGEDGDGPDLFRLGIGNARISAVIRKGIPDEMPSFAKKHSAQDIADITAYLRTLR